jgi:uncharacterized protein YcbX
LGGAKRLLRAAQNAGLSRLSFSTTLVGIRIYPIKGLRGDEHDSAFVEPRGLRHDRRWMLVDADGAFLSQRSNPELALFHVSAGPEKLDISRPCFGSIRGPLVPSGTERQVTVWRNTLSARQVSADVDEWFSEALGQAVSLVAMTKESDRPVNPDFAKQGDQLSFADGFPLLLANITSLEDLNARMGLPLPMNRFRPNLIVQHSAPWTEDGWKRIRVGSVRFRVAKPCGRCLVTTTDQETGERGVEPLRTLATFRQVDQQVNFGMNLIPDGVGEIRVGDLVSVTTVDAGPHG